MTADALVELAYVREVALVVAAMEHERPVFVVGPDLSPEHGVLAATTLSCGRYAPVIEALEFGLAHPDEHALTLPMWRCAS